jgi:hypothetical protein
MEIHGRKGGRAHLTWAARITSSYLLLFGNTIMLMTGWLFSPGRGGKENEDEDLNISGADKTLRHAWATI